MGMKQNTFGGTIVVTCHFSEVESCDGTMYQTRGQELMIMRVRGHLKL